MTPGRRWYRMANASSVVLLAALLLAPLAFDVHHDESDSLTLGGRSLPSMCLKQRISGEPCSTCGLGRSVVLLIHGDPSASAARHAGGSWLVGWVIGQLVFRFALAFVAVGPRFLPVDGLLTATTFLGVCLRVATF